MQTNRKSFGTLQSDSYIQVTVMDEWPLWQVLLYTRNSHLCKLHTFESSRRTRCQSNNNEPACTSAKSTVCVGTWMLLGYPPQSTFSVRT